MRKVVLKLIHRDTGLPLPDQGIELLAETDLKGERCQRVFLEGGRTDRWGIVRLSNPKVFEALDALPCLMIRLTGSLETVDLPRSFTPSHFGAVEIEIPADIVPESSGERQGDGDPSSPSQKIGYELEDLWAAPQLFSEFDDLKFGDDRCSRLIPVDQTIRVFSRDEIVLLEKNVLRCEQEDGALNVHRGEVVSMQVRWTRLGYSYGDLLYSLALAPGESATVALSSWEQRQMAAAQRESETHEAFGGRYERASSLSETMEGTSSQVGFGMGQITQAGLGQAFSKILTANTTRAVNFNYN